IFHKATFSDSDSAIGGLIGAILDITERQQVEDTLRSTRDYLENIFANSADGIGIVDRDGKFTRWNKAAAEIYGYTFEELKGKSAFELYTDSGELDVMLKQLRQHGFIKNYEINMKKKDGSVFPASLSIKVLRNSDNEVIGSITVSRDLSETKWMMTHLKNEIYQHKQARQALLESEQKLINIIDFLPDATFVIDTKGKIITWNRAIEEMTGFKAPDMEGKGNYEYALPLYGERRPILIDLVLEPQKGIKKYANVKREAGALTAVAHLTNFKGKETYLFAKASALIDSHGDIIGSIETIRDITDLRKAETDRLQFSKLESMSILAGGIAHDFNNILTAILGNISLAILDGKIEPQVQDRLSKAEQACLRAQGLSQQLLTFAKGGAPIKKIVSIANLLKESANLTLSGSKSRCEVSIPDDLWSVDADAGQINQVINNLLINADQSMPEGGIIKITGENCLVEAESNLPISKGKYVKFAIADQGTGISPKYLDKIFDPYFSTKQKGSGLGLATAYSIINNHSGHLQVESQLGVGTTFYIYLPAVDQGVPADEPETVKPIMGQGKVLVMDDEEIIREVLGRMLSRLAYEVDFSRDGSQAIKKYVAAQETDQPFAAVILDLTVPGGMGGQETLEKLLRIDPQVKAIVSSGYSDDQIMANFKEYGFSEVIAKPYRIVALSKILQRVISKKGD
ncbi:MAG TPA: PAS domain S-box protein, partial [Desulfobaccales bacterium]